MEEETDLRPLHPLSRFTCAVSEDDLVVFTSATTGDVLYASISDLMLSSTLKDALHCQEDMESKFSLALPAGYLEAWVACRGCDSEGQLAFERVDVLARYLQAADFLADSDLMNRVGRVLGSKLLAGSTSSPGQLDRINRPFFTEQEALQVLCSLSPEAIHAVLAHCEASLNRQLIEFPKDLHGDVVEAAFPHMFSGARLELNCKHYHTAILAAVLNHNKSLRRSSSLLLKNFAVRDTGPRTSPVSRIETALHSAVRGGISNLVFDGCDMPLEFFRRLLATLVLNPELDSLDMSFSSYIHSKSSAIVKRSIPFHLFTDYQVVLPLACLTSLRSLTLSTVHPSGDGSQLGLSPFIIASSQTVGLSLAWALRRLTNLTHLGISHAMDPAEATKFLPFLPGLQSLHIGIIHHNSIAVDDCGPLLYQVPLAASSNLAAAFRSLKCLKKLTLNAPALKVPDDTCFRQSAGARAKWFPGFNTQGSYRDAFRCSTAVSVLSSCPSDLQQLSLVLPCSQREAHAGTIELVTAVTKMSSLEAFCVSQIRSPENLCMLARAMLSPTYAFLTQLRFEDAFFAPDAVEIADPGRMARTTSAACCQIYKLLPQLPSLLEFGMHFSDPTALDATHPDFSRCTMPQLLKLDLNVNIRDRFGAPLIVGNLLSLCAHEDLHTLLLSVESGVMRAVSTEDYLIGRLQRPLAAATCLRHLQIKFRHDELRSFERLQNSLSGLNTLTYLSLDLKCSNYCMEKLSNFFASLIPLVNLQTLQLSLYRNLPLRGPCADLQPRSGMVISPCCEESLSIALWSMTHLRVLRMYGWCFGQDCLKIASPLSAVLNGMTQLEELELNCGEVRGGSIIKMLSKSLQSPRRLQKLVAGPWNLVQDSIRTLKQLIQGVPSLRQVDISNCTINTYAVPILGSLLRTVTHLTDFTVPDREIPDDDAVVISKAFVDDLFRFRGLWNLPERREQQSLKDQAKDIPSMYPTQDTNYIGHSSRSMESIAPKPVGMLDTDVQWFYNG